MLKVGCIPYKCWTTCHNFIGDKLGLSVCALCSYQQWCYVNPLKIYRFALDINKTMTKQKYNTISRTNPRQSCPEIQLDCRVSYTVFAVGCWGPGLLRMTADSSLISPLVSTHTLPLFGQTEDWVSFQHWVTLLKRDHTTFGRGWTSKTWLR